MNARAIASFALAAALIATTAAGVYATSARMHAAQKLGQDSLHGRTGKPAFIVPEPQKGQWR